MGAGRSRQVLLVYLWLPSMPHSLRRRIAYFDGLEVAETFVTIDRNSLLLLLCGVQH